MVPNENDESIKLVSKFSRNLIFKRKRKFGLHPNKDKGRVRYNGPRDAGKESWCQQYKVTRGWDSGLKGST